MVRKCPPSSCFPHKVSQVEHIGRKSPFVFDKHTAPAAQAAKRLQVPYLPSAEAHKNHFTREKHRHCSKNIGKIVGNVRNSFNNVVVSISSCQVNLKSFFSQGRVRSEGLGSLLGRRQATRQSAGNNASRPEPRRCETSAAHADIAALTAVRCDCTLTLISTNGLHQTLRSPQNTSPRRSFSELLWRRRICRLM